MPFPASVDHFSPPLDHLDLGLVSSASVPTLSSLILTLLSPPMGALVIALGTLDNARSSPHLRTPNLITPSKPLLLCIVTYSQEILGVRVWPSFGGPTT